MQLNPISTIQNLTYSLRHSFIEVEFGTFDIDSSVVKGASIFSSIIWLSQDIFNNENLANLASYVQMEIYVCFESDEATFIEYGSA